MRKHQQIDRFEPSSGTTCGFVILWDYDRHWADFRVYDVISADEQGNLLYPQKEWQISADMVASPLEAEVYISGNIKWDGCSDLDITPAHWCGVEEWIDHCELLKFLWTRWLELEPNEERDPWT